MILHPLLEKVFQALDQAKICWCLLRLPCNLSAPSGDVDLLIDRAHARDVQRILGGLGFVRLPGNYGTDALYLSYDRETDHWILLDVATELAFGPSHELQTHAEAGCLARRRRDGLMVVLDPDDAFWALLLHCLLDKRGIVARHAARLQELVAAARADGPLTQVIEKACPPGWSPARMIECVRGADWITLEEFAPALAATWRRQYPMRVSRMFANRAFRLAIRFIQVARRRGLSVALLGPDGAGKSTLAAGIQHSFYFPVRPVYMGMWLTSTAPLYRRVPGSILTRRVLLLWSRYLRAQYHQLQGRLVIFDRHSYEYLVHLDRPLPWIGRAYYWLQAHAIPKPDLVMVLDAPGDLMYQRKGERNVADLEAERQRLLALRHHIPQLEVVDATRDKDTLRTEVVERIWQEYIAHWRLA